MNPQRRTTHVPLEVTQGGWAAIGERLDVLAGTERER